MAIVVRKDLGMRAGKIAAQVAHGAVLSVMHNPTRRSIVDWMRSGQKKIVLKVNTEEDLWNLVNTASRINVKFFEVIDYGLTQIDPNSLTCVAFGPDDDSRIDNLVGGLKLL